MPILWGFERLNYEVLSVNYEVLSVKYEVLSVKYEVFYLISFLVYYEK